MRQRDAGPIFSYGRQGLRGRLVLAVDDEEDHLLAYELAFGKEPDLRLITATNTRAAGIALAEYSVDAVLLDLLVPDDGGILLCRRIKAQSRLRRVPAEAVQPRANRRGCALLS